MTEWYVLMLGNDPKEIIMGRAMAIRIAVKMGNPTLSERDRAVKMLEGPLPDQGEELRFAGTRDDKTGRLNQDVRLVRVLGPGSEV